MVKFDDSTALAAGDGPGIHSRKRVSSFLCVCSRTEVKSVENWVQKRNSHFERAPLPIDEVEDQIVEKLSSEGTKIFLGETGSGKSTQLPKVGLLHVRVIWCIDNLSCVFVRDGTGMGDWLRSHNHGESPPFPSLPECLRRWNAISVTRFVACESKRPWDLLGNKD